jgi:hypothetical protein
VRPSFGNFPRKFRLEYSMHLADRGWTSGQRTIFGRTLPVI